MIHKFFGTLFEALFVVLVFIFFSLNAKGQTDTIRDINPKVVVSGFLDVYYAYDFNKPQTQYRQPFFYNHNRHNQVNLNNGFIKVGINDTKYRANLALQTGTYANDNYASEQAVFQHLYEGNIGLALNKTNNLWLDAGIFGSHIGFESAVSIDNWTLTRSLLAENSPYYFSGIKLTYNANKHWEVAGLICNGWQRIQRIPGNSLPAVCTQVKYSNNEKLSINWSTFIGTDDPDIKRRMRYFNNLYSQLQLSKKTGLIAGFDFGAQQKTKSKPGMNYWFSPVLIARYAFNNRWAGAVRYEYYQDENGIILSPAASNAFKAAGVSLNADYMPVSNVACRIESRWLNSQDKLFPNGIGFSENNVFLVASIAIKFGQALKP